MQSLCGRRCANPCASLARRGLDTGTSLGFGCCLRWWLLLLVFAGAGALCRRGGGQSVFPGGRSARGVAVGFDALLADLLGDLSLFGQGLLLQADALLGHGPLLDDRDLFVQHQLVLFL
jgi:hypothetical protein